MADIPKVPRAKFEAVIKALLNTPPMPLSDIPQKRRAKANPMPEVEQSPNDLTRSHRRTEPKH